MKKWKVAIVGAGYMALEHTKAFASLGNVEIAGICSRTVSRAEELAANFQTKAFGNIAEMYDQTKADIVIVAVSELSMLSVCVECFNYPWLCFLEKPVGIDLREAEKILAAAEAKRARAFVALNRRSYSSTRQAIEKVQQHEGVRLISITDQQDMAAAREYGTPEKVVRNFMYANSIHLIDYFSLFGRGDVVGVDSTLPWNPDSPGFVVSTIHFSSGDVGVYQAVWDNLGRGRLL
ncbi:MAG: Gfo/Idh/MocA family oxidoreductase [Cellvibrio sp.]|nr:Gfo/Idh/MocA family oxidoreductase [Cellvibrio sp.]